jgi:GST-like protein
MIRLYFNPAPNPFKIALALEELGMAYELVPVDPRKGEQHSPEFRAINPNGKMPAIIDTDGAGGNEVRVFDSTAILMYLAEKSGRLQGSPEDRPELLSWLMFIGTGIGPFSGQAVHFQHAAPAGNEYGVNRYLREIERHYEVLDKHLAGRDFIVGNELTIADISAWGWLRVAPRVFKDVADAFAPFPNIQRWFQRIDALPAAARAREAGKDLSFKQDMDEAAQRAMFPSNFPKQAV